MWIGLAFAVILVAIRTHVQYKSSQRLFVNDFWIFFALLCHFATAIVYQLAISPMYELAYVSAGLQLPRAGFMERASLFLKLQYAADLLLWTTLWSVKFSLLFFFWRLFDSVNSSMRLFWWIMCGVTASTWVTSVVLQEFACDPIRNFFTLGKKPKVPVLDSFTLNPGREMRIRERSLLFQSRFSLFSRDRHCGRRLRLVAHIPLIYQLYTQN